MYKQKHSSYDNTDSNDNIHIIIKKATIGSYKSQTIGDFVDVLNCDFIDDNDVKYFKVNILENPEVLCGFISLQSSDIAYTYKNIYYDFHYRNDEKEIPFSICLSCESKENDILIDYFLPYFYLFEVFII